MIMTNELSTYHIKRKNNARHAIKLVLRIEKQSVIILPFYKQRTLQEGPLQSIQSQ